MDVFISGILSPVDLTVSQAAVLPALSVEPHLSNPDLAWDRFVTPQSMVALLSSLESRGLIVRRPHPAGGRAMPAEITARGSEQLMVVRMAMREVEHRCCGPGD
jgi:DNA-binding MarR family transcriptional regulator